MCGMSVQPTKPGGENQTTPTDDRLPTRDWPALQQFLSSPVDRARYLIQTYRREAGHVDGAVGAVALARVGRRRSPWMVSITQRSLGC